MSVFVLLSLGKKLITCTAKTSFFKGNVPLLGLATVTGIRLPGEVHLTESSLLVVFFFFLIAETLEPKH